VDRSGLGGLARHAEQDSVFKRSMPSDVIRWWTPVRVKKTRQSKS
jgi:hypothetical protein